MCSCYYLQNAIAPTVNYFIQVKMCRPLERKIRIQCLSYLCKLFSSCIGTQKNRSEWHPSLRLFYCVDHIQQLMLPKRIRNQVFKKRITKTFVRGFRRWNSSWKQLVSFFKFAVFNCSKFFCHLKFLQKNTTM